MTHSMMPWSVKVDSEGTEQYTIVDAHGIRVAVVPEGATAKDDAALIADAPQMASTIRLIRVYLEGWVDSRSFIGMQIAQEVKRMIEQEMKR